MILLLRCILALTANFFKKLSDATGVDGVELYNRYGPAFEKKDESLNLTGETRESDAIGKGGGAYTRYAGKYILDKDTSITTVVHEFGHFYLDSLERVAKDSEFAVDKTKVEQEIAAIKQMMPLMNKCMKSLLQPWLLPLPVMVALITVVSQMSWFMALMVLSSMHHFQPLNQ